MPSNKPLQRVMQPTVTRCAANAALVTASTNRNKADTGLSAATAAQTKAESDLKDAKLSAAADVVSHVVGGSQGGGAPYGTGTYPQGNVVNYAAPAAIVPMDSVAPLAGAATSITAAKPVTSGADLVLEDIQLAAPATLVAGPAYTVKFRNQGTDPASKFQVAVLAGIDDKVTADAPRGVVEVKSLAPGQSGEVTLRLPQTALKMNGADGRSIPFTHLFVVVDLTNTIAETDESNNSAILERVSLKAPTAK